MDKYYIKLCKFFGNIKFGKESNPSKELIDSLEFLEWNITPQEIVNAAKAITIFSGIFFIFITIIALLLNLNILIFIFLSGGIPILLNHIISEYPKNKAKQKALSALSNSPQIITQIATSLRQNPNLENAVAFVAKYGEGQIAKDFKKILQEVYTGKSESLFQNVPKIADKYGKWFEGFQRAIYLILSSFHERGMKRKRETLNKAVEVVLTDFIDKMKEYTSSLHIPTLFLFGFGIIMPLILVSVFPLISFFGGEMSLESIEIFLLISLIGVYFYSEMILRKRPPMFTIADVEHEIPEGYLKIGKYTFPAIPFVIVIILLISSPGIFYLFAIQKSIIVNEIFLMLLKPFNTLPIIWGFGIGIFIYYYFTYAYLKQKHDKIKKIENDVPDALYYFKNTLAEGKPAEEALEFVGKMKSGTDIGKQFYEAAKLMKRRYISFEEITQGKESPFYKDSKLLSSCLSLIAISMQRGIVSTIQTCTVLIEYITRLKRVERSLISMLQRNLSMMKMTAMIFAPVVSAIVVVLFQLIVNGILTSINTQNLGAFGEISSIPFIGTGPIQKPSFTPEELQLVLGLYMIGINFVLIRYITIIMYGYDKVQIGIELSQSMIIALSIFTLVLFVMKGFIGV
ncbi:MAG: hypothetical protein QXR03_02365 [Candidatus Aenigmatarchaeota archaeon]